MRINPDHQLVWDIVDILNLFFAIKLSNNATVSIDLENCP